MAPMTTTNSRCDIHLLIMASESAYCVSKDNTVDREKYRTVITSIEERGYQINKGIAPQHQLGGGTTPLAATCLTPVNGDGPIVIAFRGTETKGDVVSDLLIGTNGVVEKKFRDAAFKFYTDTKKNYPEREIILTGHSLGGHLAQYVATKACNEANMARQTLPNLQVRTFNTAPINTNHDAFFKKHHGFLARFVNYRLSPDLVSDLPTKKSYGDIFSFPSKKNFLKAHTLQAMLTDLPPDILKQEVGGRTLKSLQHNLLLEQVRGAFKSYHCRIEGQWFSKYRQGSKNLSVFNSVKEDILSALENKDYTKALNHIKTIEGQLSGSVSTKILNILKINIEIMKGGDLKKALQDLKKDNLLKEPNSDHHSHEQPKGPDLNH